MLHRPLRVPTRLIVLATYLFATPFALADQSIGFAWNHCQGDVGATQNAAFACDTNTGMQVAYGTFTLASPMARVTATDPELDIVAASPTLPAWWELSGAGCRAGSLNIPPLIDPAATVCTDWSQGIATGNFVLYQLTSPNTVHVLVTASVPQTSPMDLAGDVEYFVFSMRLNNAKTVGAGACGGCLVPVCITFSSLRVTTIDAEHRIITTPAVANGNIITWQSGMPGVPGCMGATPTRRSTWGSVKSLYH